MSRIFYFGLINMKITEIRLATRLKPLSRPLFICKVAAGFPSPAEDYIDKRLDLNNYLIKHAAATFFLRVSGDSMIGAGIFSNDILIVDRSITAKSGKIVIAIVNGEMTVKRIIFNSKQTTLYSENDEYPNINITDDTDFEIWGVVTYVIHKAE